MKRILPVLAVLAVLMTAGDALAQAAASAPAAPKPAAELAQLKFFIGNWTCKGQAEASPWGAAHPTTAKVHIASEVKGFWLLGSYVEDKAAANPMPVHIAFTWGWDSKDKLLDAFSFDNFGGWQKAESKGWEGDKLVFAGETVTGGKAMASRDSFTKKGDNQVTHMFEMQMDGKWMKLDEETCTRAGGAAKK